MAGGVSLFSRSAASYLWAPRSAGPDLGSGAAAVKVDTGSGLGAAFGEHWDAEQEAFVWCAAGS